jgi:KDO2-lipid IV(A) lauroyltransferase
MTAPALSARLLLSLLRAIPAGSRKFLFKLFFAVYYYVGSKRRLIAYDNLKKAFTDKSMKEIRKIARGVYRNMAIVVTEFVDLPYRTKETIGKIVEVEGLEYCKSTLEKGRGLIFLGGTFRQLGA